MNDRKRALLLVLLFASALVPGSILGQVRPDALELYKQGNYQRAVDVCLEELKEQPQNMNSFVVLGWSLLKLGRFQEAHDFGRRAMEVSRYDHRVIQIVGEALYFLGRHRESLKYFEEYVVVAPSGDLIDEVYYLMGEIYIRLGEFNHADIALTTAVYHDPNVAGWWARLGFAREQAKDYRAALEAYNRSLQLNPGLSDAARGRQRVQGLATTG